ncbi:NAD-binding protein [Mycena vulgaris]|nr:NAD-binding protein [Mycena vulgaris]
MVTSYQTLARVQFNDQSCSRKIVYATARSEKSITHKNVRKLILDVTDDVSVTKAIDQVYAETDGIDVLISNAGCSHIGASIDTPFVDGMRVSQTNFFGFVRLVNAVVPRMGKRRKGTVVAIGSILGELPVPFAAFYNASKAALHSYTETLHMECQVINVKVVLIAPGSIRSNVSVNTAFTLPENSFYTALEKQMKHDMHQSQTKEYGVMDTDKFATSVVGKILLPTPPPYITLGGFTTVIWLLKWLPPTVAEAFIWRGLQKEPKAGT